MRKEQRRKGQVFYCALVGVYCFVVGISQGKAERYPGGPGEVIGELRETQARQEDTLIDIARRFDLGYEQMVKANPRVNRWVPGAGLWVTLPSRYIIPRTPREGIVLNVPELRLYYFSPSGEILTYPVSVGRMDWKTPHGVAKVVKKEKDPAWHPPASIRREHAAEGDILPPFIPGGSPDNPLGRYALRLSLEGYLIHGTDERKSFGIGMRVTHGCVRMYPEDIEALFYEVKTGTPVRIIDEPIKVGVLDGVAYLEAHLPFEEDEAEPSREEMEELRVRALRLLQAAMVEEIDERKVEATVSRGDGIPIPIGKVRKKTLSEELFQ